MIKKTLFVFVLIWGWMVLKPVGTYAENKIKIAATTTTLASICGEITGERAEIYSIASPNRDIHFYAPTPKDVLKVKKADVFVHMGLDLEMWRDPLLVAAGNPRFLGGGDASIDASRGISLLEIPTSLSRAQGDIHLYGNPHYWLDPENAKIMARNIAEGLSQVFPEDSGVFMKNAETFTRKIDEKMKDWETRLVRYRGAPVVTYHNSWPYFAQRFGLVGVGHVEPKPGIPPSPKHIADLIRLMKEKGVKIIIKESFQESQTPKKIARETSARVLTLASAVGETRETSDYVSMIEHDIQLLQKALEEKP